ncbi:MAG: hypothetical protein MAG715_00497 [Methanonatronarchaeales archaeon]|nr:hypothetical protein [Methanonatronarchaeales archaeon]
MEIKNCSGLPELLEAALITLAIGDVATTVYAVNRWGVWAEGNWLQRGLMEVSGVGPWTSLLIPTVAVLLIAAERRYAPLIAKAWVDGRVTFTRAAALVPAVLVMSLNVARNLAILTFGG